MTKIKNKTTHSKYKKFLDESTSIAEDFIEHTKIKRYQIPPLNDCNDFVKQLFLNQYMKEVSLNTIEVSNSIKEFKGFKSYKLPLITKQYKQDLIKLIGNRESHRQYSGQNISLNEVSTLLYSYKAKSNVDNKLNIKLRNIPSAGALYPLDIYVYLLKNLDNNLPAGLYYYNALTHSLVYTGTKISINNLKESFNQPEISINKCAAIFFVTGALYKNSWKYGDRALRYLFIEAGHLVQNLCLITTSLKLGACPIGGFIDDQINKYLNVDGIDEFVVYILAIGKIE